MDKKIEKIINRSKDVRLSDAKKELIKGNLIYFIRNAAVRELASSRQTGERSLLTIFKFKFMTIFLAIALLFGGGAGAAFAAEGSLPGDVLYPVKQVSEDVRVALSVSAEAKAKAEAKFAERRLEEAAELIAEGRMDAEKKAELEARFKERAERVAARVEALREANGSSSAAADISAEFEASLKAHAAVLEAMARANANASSGAESQNGSNGANAGASVQADIRPLILDIKAESELWRGRGADIEARISAEGEAAIRKNLEARINAVENRVNELRDFVARKKDSVEATLYAEAEARVARAASLVVEARASLNANDFKTAIKKLLEAERIIVETRIFINTSHRLDIDFRFNGRVPQPATEPRIQGDAGVQTEASVNPSENGGSGINSEAEFRGRLRLDLPAIGADAEANGSVNAGDWMKANGNLRIIVD